MNKILSIFMDNCGEMSTMRVLNFMIIGAVLYRYIKTGQLTEMEVALVAAAITGKVVQKQVELHNICPPKESTPVNNT